MVNLYYMCLYIDRNTHAKFAGANSGATPRETARVTKAATGGSDTLLWFRSYIRK